MLISRIDLFQLNAPLRYIEATLNGFLFISLNILWRYFELALTLKLKFLSAQIKDRPPRECIPSKIHRTHFDSSHLNILWRFFEQTLTVELKF